VAQEGRAFAFRGPLLGASMLGNQRGAQLLPLKRLLLFNISIHSSERNTPAVIISFFNLILLLLFLKILFIYS